MRFLPLFCLIGFAQTLPASAYQQILTYRIAGTDIQSVTLAPHVDEDPAAMTLQVRSDSGQPNEILIESDGGLDDCKRQLDYIVGSKDAYAEIVIDINAQTMNGVLVLQCATFYGLFGE